jgi:hypothetical protein
VRFDDRLNTVLALRPNYAHDRAVRWRQLVELLARGGGAEGPLVERALAEVRSEAPQIDEQLRAATARAVASPDLPVPLVTLFAEDSIAVAAPVLVAAKLSDPQWAEVVERASASSRRFLRSLHPELGIEESPAPQAPPASPATEQPPAAPVASEPPPQAQQEPAGEPPATAAEAPATAAPVPSITELVARIEQLRQERDPAPPAPAAESPQAPAPARQPAPQLAPQPPLRAAPPPPTPQRGPVAAGLFRWECGPSGEISWVEGVPRGAFVGRSLSNPGEFNGVDERIQRALAARAPFRDAALNVRGEGVAAGEWRLSGVPAFEPADGRFAGYRGVGTRGDTETSSAPAGGSARELDTASLRELVHELKTPLNAIIGFAEIIDGQYLGPADHSYRDRAASIVAQARQLLSAIEDLDLAAQLRADPDRAGGTTDLRDLIAQASAELADLAGRRGAALATELPAQPLRCPVETGLARRLVRRFCGSVIDAAASGERLRLSLFGEAERCLLAIEPPAGLLLAGNADPERDANGAGGVAGVSLRLVRALVRVAGGDLLETPEALTLVLPRAR